MNNIELAYTSAFGRHKRIVDLVCATKENFLELGMRLCQFEENRDYEKLGHASFNAYLADPDVDMSRSQAYELIGLYRDYELRLEIPREKLLLAGPTKLGVIRRVVDEENVYEWISKAETLSRSDLRHEVNGTEPIIKPGMTWEQILVRARHYCHLLMQESSANEDVKRYAADFWQYSLPWDETEKSST